MFWVFFFSHSKIDTKLGFFWLYCDKTRSWFCRLSKKIFILLIENNLCFSVNQREFQQVVQAACVLLDTFKNFVCNRLYKLKLLVSQILLDWITIVGLNLCVFEITIRFCLKKIVLQTAEGSHMIWSFLFFLASRLSIIFNQKF